MSSLFALALGMASCSSGDDVTSSPLEMAQQKCEILWHSFYRNRHVSVGKVASASNSWCVT